MTLMHMERVACSSSRFQTPELKTMVDEELESKGRASAALALRLQLLGVAFGATALYLITR